MRLILRIAAVVIVFGVCASITQYIAESVPGTPTHEFSALLDASKTVVDITTTLNSDKGSEMATAHSSWILLLFLPIASICAASVGRVLNITRRTILIVVLLWVSAYVLGMFFASRAISDITGALGMQKSLVDNSGASIGTIVSSFVVCGFVTTAVASVKYCPCRHGVDTDR